MGTGALSTLLINKLATTCKKNACDCGNLAESSPQYSGMWEPIERVQHGLDAEASAVSIKDIEVPKKRKLQTTPTARETVGLDGVKLENIVKKTRKDQSLTGHCEEHQHNTADCCESVDSSIFSVIASAANAAGTVYMDLETNTSSKQLYVCVLQGKQILCLVERVTARLRALESSLRGNITTHRI